jgi:hypothetical protein
MSNGSTLRAYKLRCACSALCLSSYLPYDTVEGYEEDSLMSVLPTHFPSPEEVLIRRETFSTLSDEAKEIIRLILNAPAEVAEQLKTPKGKVSINLVRVYLHRTGKMPYRKILRAEEEIRKALPCT